MSTMEHGNGNEFSNDEHFFKIITFNLLTPDYATPSFYPFSQRKYLNFGFRSEKVKSLITSWIKSNFIICLQEVNITWKQFLDPLFNENNYCFYSSLYFDGKMGVGIAFPKNHYDCILYDYYMCSEHIVEVKNKIIETDDDMLTLEESGLRKNILAELDVAGKYENMMCSALLRIKHFGKLSNKRILVSTYHMPCKYNMNYLLIANINSFKVRLMNLLKNCPDDLNGKTAVVFTGDLNITSSHILYNYLVELPYTSYQIDNDAKFINILASIYKKNGYDIFDGCKLHSAYRSLYSKEPKYTNVHHTNESRFMECLDYVLINENIIPRSGLVGLKVDDPYNTSYPNGLCPSDHLPLSITFII
jgi:mRNA deadenylase 3'-5' endonuclease subunit Ccr4